MEILYMDITDKCNLKCLHCYNDSSPASNKELSHEDIILLFEQFKNNGGEEVLFIGGEPLIKKDIIDIFQLANDKGLLVSFTTNATLLNEKIINNLKNLKIRRINFSLDGATSETHDYIRGNGSFKKIIDNIRNLFFLYPNLNDNIALACAYTLLFHNIRDKKEPILLLNLLKELNIPAISLQRFWMNGRGTSIEEPSVYDIFDFLETFCDNKNKIYPQLFLTVEEQPSVIEYLNTKYKMNIPLPPNHCEAFKRFLIADAEGHIYPCGGGKYTDFNKHLGYISIDELSLDKLEKNPYYADFCTQRDLQAVFLQNNNVMSENMMCQSCDFKMDCPHFHCIIPSSYEKQPYTVEEISPCLIAKQRLQEFKSDLLLKRLQLSQSVIINNTTLSNIGIELMLEEEGMKVIRDLNSGLTPMEIIDKIGYTYENDITYLITNLYKYNFLDEI